MMKDFDRLKRACALKKTPLEAPDSGAALISMLMLVALIGFLAALFLTNIRQASETLRVAQAQQDHFWQVYAGEMLAASFLRQQKESIDLAGKTTFEQPWNQGVFSFPLKGARDGVITLSFQVADDCFNLNGLLSTGGDLPNDPPFILQRAILHRLFNLILFEAAHDITADILTDRISDWLDSDDKVRAYGSEDIDYRRLIPPYRSGNQAFAHISELRAIHGITAPVYKAVTPFLCVLPEQKTNKLNVNLLSEASAPLLAAFLGETVTPQEALQILRARPTGGFNRLHDFWQQPLLKNKDIPDDRKNLFDIKSRYFRLFSQIATKDGYVRYESLFFLGDNKGDPVRWLGRQFNSDQAYKK